MIFRVPIRSEKSRIVGVILRRYKRILRVTIDPSTSFPGYPSAAVLTARLVSEAVAIQAVLVEPLMRKLALEAQRWGRQGYLGGWIIPVDVSVVIGSPIFISHKTAMNGRGTTQSLADLLTIVVNHLLTGMILQVPDRYGLRT